MPNLDTTSVLESLAAGLEAMAFISVEPLEPPFDAPPEPQVVSIDFTGPSSGTVELVAPAAFGRCLAANALGGDPCDERAAAYALDALKELLNIVCGSLLRQWGGAEDYNLSLPRLAPLCGGGWDEFVGSGGAAVVDAEGSRIALRVRAAA